MYFYAKADSWRDSGPHLVAVNNRNWIDSGGYLRARFVGPMNAENCENFD